MYSGITNIVQCTWSWFNKNRAVTILLYWIKWQGEFIAYCVVRNEKLIFFG